MVKQRMSTADVAAEAACLRQRLLGMRVANIYDVNAKTYLLKLSRSGEDGEKIFLLLESGLRFHTTEMLRDKSDTPSNFTLKLRKHLRTRRLDDVRQLGVDRLIDFSFGSGPNCHHLLLELYAQGNLILTDSSYEILTLLRSYRDDDKGYAIMAKHPYPIRTVRNRVQVTAEALADALAKAGPKPSLKGVVTRLVSTGPALAEHSVLTANLDPKRDPTTHPLAEGEQAALLQGVHSIERWLEQMESSAPPGFVFYKALESREQAYEDFDPLLLRQSQQRPHLDFDTFDGAVDEFFSKVAGQQAARAQQAQQQAVVTKLDKVKTDQARRADALGKEAADAELKGTLIEYNAEAVDAAIHAVRQALAGGLGWKELKALIRRETEAGNPVASMVASLQLESNRATLLLSNLLDGDEDDDEALTRPATKVEVDLDLNAYANARAHFEQRKVHAVKQAKTVAANERALKAAEQKAEKQLSQAKKITIPVAPRKAYWFERFNWFVTSENLLVLSGRDMQQNELLVKRHLGRGDIYVHADLHGASSTIVKAAHPDQAVGPVSLAQAGCACLCRSQAWDAKIVTSAWWVHHDQVSKSAPTGEYLATGSFMVRGKKNFLPPFPLVMGFTFLFKLDEASVAGHLGERAPKAAADEEAGEALAEANTADDTGTAAVAAGSEAASKAAGSADLGGTGGSLGVGESRIESQGGINGERRESSSSAYEAFLEGAADPYATSRSRGGVGRYGLEAGPGRSDSASRAEADIASSRDDDSAAASAAAASKGSRHLSAKERRQLKKQADQPADEQGGGSGEAAACPASLPAAAPPAEAASIPGAKPQEPLTRGKKSKARRAKEKYADQDEDERLLALDFLGSAGQHRSKQEKREARRAGRKQDEAAEALAQAVHRPPTAAELAAANVRPLDAPIPPRYSQKPPEASASSDTEAGRPLQEAAAPQEAVREAGAEEAEAAGSSVEEAADSSSGDDSQEAGVASDPGEEAEVEAVLEAEDIALLPDADRERLREVDSLTGCPRPGDELLFALPMVAPYSALQSYKLRVKIVPGSQRKGKAARQATELLARSADALPREQELMRSCAEADAVAAMLGNVKLSMPGLGSKQTQARRARKKG